MADANHADQLAAQAADAVRQALAEAESRAAAIVRDAEAKAASIREQAEAEAAAIRERGESDARGQIEAAKRALDELGGTLAAAATSALPKAETEPQEADQEEPPGPGPDLEPDQPAESPGAPVSPPAEEPEPEQAAPAAGNGDDAAERLVAMKMAVDGKDQAAIDAELTEKFGPRDRTEMLREVLERVAR
jgi:GAF domain-containing protein